jgi:hypothetical protein
LKSLGVVGVGLLPAADLGPFRLQTRASCLNACPSCFTLQINYSPAAVPRAPVERLMGIFNAMTTVFFAYGGHNVALEIQATIPSDSKTPNMHTSTVPAMMRGVNVTFLITGGCSDRVQGLTSKVQDDTHCGTQDCVNPVSLACALCLNTPMWESLVALKAHSRVSLQPAVLFCWVHAQACASLLC